MVTYQLHIIIEVDETVNNIDAYLDIRGVKVKIANIALLFQWREWPSLKYDESISLIMNNLQSKLGLLKQEGHDGPGISHLISFFQSTWLEGIL